MVLAGFIEPDLDRGEWEKVYRDWKSGTNVAAAVKRLDNQPLICAPS